MTSAQGPIDSHVVIIGAGVAGLAAAVRLRTMGLRVTLLERHDHLGGKIRTTPSAAGPVDAGPTVLTMRHVFDDLFAAAGTRLEDHVELVPQPLLARHFWADGSRLDLHADRDPSVDAIGAFAGSRAAQDFRSFCDRAAALFDAFDLPMMQAPQPRMSALVRHVMAHPSLIGQMAPLSTLSGLLRRQFRDPRLRQLFGRYATYVGGAPHLTPAVLALIWHAAASGVWVVRGGMHRLAEAIADLATHLGVDLRTGTYVARIGADMVVCADDPRALATGALGPAVSHVAPGTLRATRSFSARVHSFAARAEGPELAHHNIFFADEGQSEFRDLVAGRVPAHPTLYLCAEDRGLGALSDGPERFELIANAPATPEHTPPEDLDRWHQRIMTRMQRFGVQFSPTPAAGSVTTPQSFARMFPESLGRALRAEPARVVGGLSPSDGADIGAWALPLRGRDASWGGGADGDALRPARGRGDLDRLAFDVAVGPNGYAWYVDGLSDCGTRAVSVIGIIGSVFSPWYRWSGQRNPQYHVCIHVATFGPGGRFTMTNRGQAALRQSTDRFDVGPSSMRWVGDAPMIEIDEVRSPPLISRMRGRIVLHPAALTRVELPLTPDGAHVWRPFAPRARIKVDIDRPGWQWAGEGYFDANFGTRALEEDFSYWTWGRYPTSRGATCFYDAERIDGSTLAAAFAFDDHGTARAVPLPPKARLPRSLRAVRRERRADPGFQPRQVLSMLDAPFYTRAAVQTRLGGEEVVGVHEALDLARFRSPLLKPLLALRVPRRAGWSFRPPPPRPD